MQSINFQDNDSDSYSLNSSNNNLPDISESEYFKYILAVTSDDRPKPKGRPAKSLVHINGQAASYCNKCHKLFTNSSALAKHRLAHSEERKYVCNICNRAFKRPDHLSGHLMTHSDIKPFACQMENCSKSYCDARSLRRHHNRFHAPFLIQPHFLGSNNLEENLIDVESPEKILICSECKKTFKNASALNGHMRLHRRINDSHLNVQVSINNLCNIPLNHKDISNRNSFSHITEPDQDVIRTNSLDTNSNSFGSIDFMNSLSEQDNLDSISNILTNIYKYNYLPIRNETPNCNEFEKDLVNVDLRQFDSKTISNSVETLHGDNHFIKTINGEINIVKSKELDSNLRVEYPKLELILNNNNNNINGTVLKPNIYLKNTKSSIDIDKIFTNFGKIYQNSGKSHEDNSYEKYYLETISSSKSNLEPTVKAFITDQLDFEDSSLIQSMEEKHKIINCMNKSFKKIKSDKKIEHVALNSSNINISPNLNASTYKGIFKRIERVNRPHPLIIPCPSTMAQATENNPFLSKVLNMSVMPPATPFAFQSNLRSPRILSNENLSLLTPYTPPPMLSPFRSGSGLYCHLKKDLFPGIIEEEAVEKEEMHFVEIEKTPMIIQTDISPHINIGEEYQAIIPDISCTSSYYEDYDALLWHPEILLKFTEDEINLYLDFSTSLCLAHNGSNKELAYHLLFIKQGDLTQAIKSLLQENLKIKKDSKISNYKYQESALWSKKEIEFFTKEINGKGKDFYLLSTKKKKVPTATLR